jgi:hypothetical protein
VGVGIKRSRVSSLIGFHTMCLPLFQSTLADLTVNKNNKVGSCLYEIHSPIFQLHYFAFPTFLSLFSAFLISFNHLLQIQLYCCTVQVE